MAILEKFPNIIIIRALYEPSWNIGEATSSSSLALKPNLNSVVLGFIVLNRI